MKTDIINHDNKKTFIFYILSSLLFYFPIINAGLYYRDDLHRGVTGYYGWNYLGRPFANYLSEIITFSNYKLMDIFPLNIIISCFFISVSCILIKIYILDKHKIKNSSLISLLFIFNPLFIQNMMYRFDSIQMSASILMSVLAYSTYNKNFILNILLKSCIAFIALSLYQPCFNIFISLICVEIMCMTMKSSKSEYKKTINLILFNFLYFLFSYIFYLLIINLIFGVSSKRGEILPISFDSINQIIKTEINALGFFEVIFMDLGNKLFFLSFFAFSLILFLYQSISRKMIIRNIIFLFLSLFVFIISFLGPTVILKSPPLMARTIVTMPIILIISCIILSAYNKIKYLPIIIALPLLSMSYYIGNAATSQRNYELNIFNMIHYDILNKINDKYSKVVVYGTPSYSKTTELIEKQHYIVRLIVTPADGFRASFLLTQIGVDKVEQAYGKDNEYRDLLAKIKNLGIKPISCNKIYSIYFIDQLVFINLNGCNYRS
ncbi:glucosyltransferase domain-containing protein [Proteus mirabilis]|uniref:glucosyltransferase domain-containing protein n=2 Tax=Proteus mirabilis TaxID=584 RepID=UPI0034D4DD2F